MAMEDYDMASSYLKRCIDFSADSKSVIVARFLLADLFRQTNNFQSAQEQYFIILETSGENAEVRFQLGELYFLQRDTTRARAEWRLAYRYDPAHAGARARLNI
jgi:tetratricopeptide (TPR) repeat protein